MLYDVAVEPADAQAGEGVADLALDAFRPAAQITDARRAARRTARCERRRPTAVMAAQRRPGLVVDERALAIRTGLDVAAIPAHDDRRRAAPVEHQDRLLAGRAVEPIEGSRQRAREEATLAGSEFGAEVDDLHGRCRTDRTGRQDDPIVVACPGPPDALDGGCR
jgi:hypothetical protein